MMSCRERAFGVSLIVFYLVGSRATKVGKSLKATLEEGHQEAGCRTAWQVLCNSFTAFFASILWIALFDKDSPVFGLLPSSLASHATPYNSSYSCSVTAFHGQTWSRRLLYAALGYVL